MPSSRGKETSLNYLFYQETTNVTPLERVHQIGRNLNESFFNIFSKEYQNAVEQRKGDKSKLSILPYYYI